ncbi:MAG: hypothetical protein CVV42_07570 [Candidatus Riflebacteria bacterium HGW-Riflebacteria-2]|jgi:hypothetical protein|nr:MAG: hypothetical protein CVV42_07570 [Candidatus Riflebacteria bacterium HGW-Riflebacteria-2]
MINRRRAGFSFAEIVVAIAVFAMLAIPLYQSLHGVQTDTRKSINYFRAMELADEAIEYVRLLPVDHEFKQKAEGFSGSMLIEQSDDSFSAAKIAVGDNPRYRDFLVSDIQYSEQYNPACFYRTVEVADLSGASYAGLLKKVVVTVYWDNASARNNLHDLSRKTNKVVLATLITDWEKQP